jgi:adenine-specific DNA-methyltransferase
MPKIDITRTELVWPGKYDENGELVPPRRVNLPFQVIERVNETRATREQRVAPLQGHVGTLFDYWQVDQQASDGSDGWRNKLIWGDNLYVMGSLLERFAGKIDLIYIDPPFATGADFTFRARVGDEVVDKDQSLLEEKAYRDTWGEGVSSYIRMLYDRLRLMSELLSPSGSIYIHLGWDITQHIKVLADEILGRGSFINEVIWKRQSAHSDVTQGATHYGRVHDVILFYGRGTDFVWNHQYEPYDEEYVEAHYKHTDPETGKRFTHSDMTAAKPGGDTEYEWRVKRRIGESDWQADLIDEYMQPVKGFEYRGIRPYTGRYWGYSKANMISLEKQRRIYYTRGGTPRLKNYLDDMPGRPVQDIWDRMSTQTIGSERTGYATQKPELLLKRIILTSSNEDSLVADFFCGSGTTLAVAEELGRRWIGCDMSRYAIHTTRKRLMDIPDCRPFEILNLGQYERQVWQGVAFGDGKRTEQMRIYEYLKFILDLYGAQPLAGTQHLHGKKGSAVVHIGAVDAPVTIDEIFACLDECAAMGQKELHVLGWEWEMGLNDLMVEEAKGRGIKLLLLAIPREVMEQQAVDRGDIHFYELAYLEVAIRPSRRKNSYTVELTDFSIPNDELIPPEVRGKIKKWSDYVDYWAIDWDFRDDTFVNAWTSYRTRQDRALQLKSDPHVYEAPGIYRILVKVIDIFGNDTSQAYEVQVE